MKTSGVAAEKHNSSGELADYNRKAWDEIARAADRWFRGATADQLSRAREGDFRIMVSPTRPVPNEWLQPINGTNILCLAAGGGQQAPLLAAAGAQVIVVDNSAEQLDRDRQLAREFDLPLQTLERDMRDLDELETGCFDYVLNPCSICYCDPIDALWTSIYRLLKPGGHLITGLINPVNYLFDSQARDRGELRVRHRIPYRDLDLTQSERESLIDAQRPMEFGHSLQSMLGGIVEAGLSINGFFEDRWGDRDALSERIPVFITLRAMRRSG